ncbi:LacI family DNA-binding transcriptional regulator [Halobacillus seohaensis]|uniref:LacI family DNA-binding transcriptional regulator n=1 Tax=Halobacillus seohaensis TaxID=447421 RepID=A0ABW2EM53_9BACI
MKSITISDVAAHAEVSKSTVSQFLNKRYDYMGEKTKQRIEMAIDTLGYQPNIVARSLKQKSTKTIGVIVANILHNFSTEVSRAIEDVCNHSGFHMIICNADDDPVKEKHYIEILLAKQVDGLIIFPTGNNRDLYQKMLDNQYPLVFLDRSVEGIPISAIMLENEKASRLAVEHLVQKDYKRIGMLTTSIIHNISPRLERVSGYKKALHDYGLPMRDDYVNSVESSSVQDSLEEMLGLSEPPEAIVAGNDLVLIEILKFVKRHHLRLPEDLAVIGIDDVSFASFFTPPITTVAQPTFKMGKMAAEVLMDKINQKRIEDERLDYRFEPTLMVRDSVDNKDVT